MRKGQTQKWMSGVLGVFCLILVVHLVLQFTGTKVGASRRPMSSGSRDRRLLTKSSQNSPDDLSRFDPVLRVDLLEKFQSRAFPRPARNPFADLTLRPPAPPQPAAPPPPAPPPPPPPIKLKGVGYSLKGPGRQEAYVADEEQVYVVHDGENFGTKYHVLRITPRFIEIEDVTTHQTVELPFAQ